MTGKSKNEGLEDQTTSISYTSRCHALLANTAVVCDYVRGDMMGAAAMEYINAEGIYNNPVHTKDLAHIRGVLRDAKDEGRWIVQELKQLTNHAEQELFLLKCFIVDSLPMYFRSLAEEVFFCNSDSVGMDSIEFNTTTADALVHKTKNLARPPLRPGPSATLLRLQMSRGTVVTNCGRVM
jgi:hypothetical protein